MKKIVIAITLFIGTLSANHTYSMEQLKATFTKNSTTILATGTAISGSMYIYSRIKRQLLRNPIFSYLVVPYGVAACMAHSHELREETNKNIKRFIEHKKEESRD